MDTPGIINQAVHEVDRLLKAIGSSNSVQVRTKEEQEMIKANAFSWFKGHRTHLQTLTDNTFLNSVDSNFSLILELSDRHTSRSRYKSILKNIKADLIKLRSEAVKLINSLPSEDTLGNSPKPDFSKLISDDKMIKILNRRWDETINCIQNQAPLAAMVMMGALLESLFLARINQLSDKAPIFSLKATPKDKTKKALPLPQWGLNDFIEVAFEMNWIRKPAKEVGVIIRDYRNFIHPVKELSSGFHIEESDARMFWPIFIQISDQIIKSLK